MQLVSNSPCSLASTLILYHSSCARRACYCSTCLDSCLLLHFSWILTLSPLITIHYTIHVLTHIQYVNACVLLPISSHNPLKHRTFYINWYWFWKSKIWLRQSFMPKGRRGLSLVCSNVACAMEMWDRACPCWRLIQRIQVVSSLHAKARTKGMRHIAVYMLFSQKGLDKLCNYREHWKCTFWRVTTLINAQKLLRHCPKEVKMDSSDEQWLVAQHSSIADADGQSPISLGWNNQSHAKTSGVREQTGNNLILSLIIRKKFNGTHKITLLVHQQAHNVCTAVKSHPSK